MVARASARQPCRHGRTFSTRGTNVALNFIGQPNALPKNGIDNPTLPAVRLELSRLRPSARPEFKGWTIFPKDEWPTNIELLYYAFHVMAGLGTLFILLMGIANFQRWRGKLETSRGLLWALMLAFPLPYIATTAGWMTAELGRQPWLIFQSSAYRPGRQQRVVSGGNVLFTLIGFRWDCISCWACCFYFWSPAKSPTVRKVFLPMVNWRCPMTKSGMRFCPSCLSYLLFWMDLTLAPVCCNTPSAKPEAERRLVIAAIGPLWSWHEVWLVSFGGVLFVAFPNILAVSFSGFYLALFLVLWALLLRGISIEVSGPHCRNRCGARPGTLFSSAPTSCSPSSSARRWATSFAACCWMCVRQVFPRAFNHQLQSARQRRHFDLVYRDLRGVHSRDV